jgi:hypothetical protein
MGAPLRPTRTPFGECRLPERRESAGTVCRRYPNVEDRRRQLVVNNDVEQVADQAVELTSRRAASGGGDA